jgi:predicted DNA-binding ribbon-helix-helix protein
MRKKEVSVTKMSTKIKKLYFKSDIKTAQEELKNTNRYFTRKTKRRKTIQVRIGDKWHQKLKEVARSEKVMLSFLLDHICDHYFKHN